MLWKMTGQVARCRLDVVDKSSLEISASEFDFHHVAHVLRFRVLTKTPMPRSVGISKRPSANKREINTPMLCRVSQRLFRRSRRRSRSIEIDLWRRLDLPFVLNREMHAKFASGLGSAARRTWSYYLVILVGISSDSTASKRNASFK
jgi:hypothetical protein